MPNRIVRESILTSERMAAIGWDVEVFYRRLMSIVDDFGRFDGRPEILRARLYPLQLDKVGTPDVVKWMRCGAEAGLVREYAIGGKPYIEILRFGQPTRSASKYPDPPPLESNCAQLRATDSLSVSGSVSGFVSESVSVSVCDSAARGQTGGRGKATATTDAEQPDRSLLLEAFARLMNRPQTAINWGPIVTWLATVEGDGHMALALKCLQNALESSTAAPHTSQAAVKYVSAIYERCRHHECQPGEFPSGDSGGQTGNATSRAQANLAKLLQESAVEK